MKKMLCLMLALVMVLPLAACGEKDGDEDKGNRENMSWRELMEEGQRLLEDEEYDEAIDVLSDAIDLRDARSDLYVLRGQAYLGKGSSSALKKAVKDFETALEITKDYEEAWIGLVEALVEQEDYEKAAQRAQEGLEALGSSRELKKLLEKIEDELDAPGHETEPGYETRPGSETEPTDEPTEPVHVHSWLDANYQEPERCAECGETLGSPLVPDFQRYGIRTISATNSVGTPYVYQTACYEDPNFKTLGFLTLTDYSKLDSDDAHSYVDGYEWRIATFQLQFSDENAHNYGYSPAETYEDYYAIDFLDSTVYSDDYGNRYYGVYWYDLLTDAMLADFVLYNQWDDDTATVIIRVDAHVPVGYDGVVYGFFDSSVMNAQSESAHIYQIYNEMFLLYRFD